MKQNTSKLYWLLLFQCTHGRNRNWYGSEKMDNDRLILHCQLGNMGPDDWHMCALKGVHYLPNHFWGAVPSLDNEYLAATGRERAGQKYFQVAATGWSLWNAANSSQPEFKRTTYVNFSSTFFATGNDRCALVTSGNPEFRKKYLGNIKASVWGVHVLLMGSFAIHLCNNYCTYS